MSIKCAQVIEALENFAPQEIAESWDNVGLILGSPRKSVTRILLTLDITSQVAKEAVEKKADLIVSHHPIIMDPLKNLREDDPENQVILELIKNDIAVFCAHTNLDIAPGGVNDILAAQLNLNNLEVLYTTSREKLYKLVVFVPEDYTAQVRAALGNSGAGFIGNYSHCTFSVSGTGTFKPGEETNPFIGEKGKLTEVKEDRLETIIPEKKLKKIMSSLRESHPYEEIAYDLYYLKDSGEVLGLGRIGELTSEKTLEEIVYFLKEKFDIPKVKVCGNLDREIKRIAVCGGAGGSLVKEAFLKNADLLITGDISYHKAQRAKELNLALIDAGHGTTENMVIPWLKNFILSSLSSADFEILVSQVKTEPFIYF